MKARSTLALSTATMIGALWPRMDAGAQNLVPNGSFEEYTSCPDFWNQLVRATGWQVSAISPDYFHACSSTGYVGVPQNVVGYQLPATGQGYAGGISWLEVVSNQREFLGIELIEALVPGQTVHLEMRVAAATGGTQENRRWSVAGVGMRFSTVPYWYDQLEPLPNSAALLMFEAPIDTATWYTVSGDFTPDSSYTYLTIGNFLSDSLLTPVEINSTATFPGAYFYVDDVCVSYDPTTCLVAEVQAIGSQGQLQVSPNPSMDVVWLSWGSELSRASGIVITDALGRLVASYSVDRGSRELRLDLGGLPRGPYWLTLEGVATVPRSVQVVLLTLTQ